MQAETTTTTEEAIPPVIEAIPETPFFGLISWQPPTDAGGRGIPAPYYIRTSDNYETRDEAAKAARTLFLMATSHNALNDARILVCEEIAL